MSYMSLTAPYPRGPKRAREAPFTGLWTGARCAWDLGLRIYAHRSPITSSVLNSTSSTHNVAKAPPSVPAGSEEPLEPMTATERTAYVLTGGAFTASTLHLVQVGFQRALDAGIIGDPHIATHGWGVVAGLLMGAGMGVVTGVELVRAAIRAPWPKGAELPADANGDKTT